jgi:hypothetical protein
MGIRKVNPLEEFIDISVDEHLWLLVAIIVVIITIFGVGFYYCFWPIIEGQPEYFARPVLQSPTVGYEVFMALPKRVGPSRDEGYELTMYIQQTQVLTATQVITSNICSLSPFAKVAPSDASTGESVRSFEVFPLATEPQKFSHAVHLVIIRPANRPKTLPVEVSLAYENVRYIQRVSLHVDYWSKMIVSIVTSGALLGIVTFAMTIAKSLLKLRGSVQE